MKNYADRELCQQIYDRKLILDAEMWWAEQVNGEYRLVELGNLEHGCPAYNCVELLDALPPVIEIYLPDDKPDPNVSQNNLKYVSLTITKEKDSYVKYSVNYCYNGRYIRYYSLHLLYDYSLCNALSKMILYLNNKGLLKE